MFRKARRKIIINCPSKIRVEVRGASNKNLEMWEHDSCASSIIKSVKTTVSHNLINVIKMYLLDGPITIA